MNIPDFLKKQANPDLPVFGGNAIESSTIFHTPVGDLEVPGPSIPIPEVRATFKSNIAPLWLVFPKLIVNTQRITGIRKAEDGLRIFTSDGKKFDVVVTDLEKTWAALQKVFAEGVSDE
jgi:hypothetical protein